VRHLCLLASSIGLSVLLHFSSSTDNILAGQLSRLLSVLFLPFVQNCVGLVHSVRGLVDLLLLIFLSRSLRRHVYHLEHVLLESFLLEEESVFVPDKVWSFWIKVVSLHAALEQPNHVSVVRFFSEAEFAAVVHVLLELFRMPFA